MKKFFLILLFCFTVFMTSCNGQNTHPGGESGPMPAPLNKSLSGISISPSPAINDISEYIKTGREALRTMDYKKALDAFNRAVDCDSNNAWALAGRAETLWLLEKFDQAIEDVEKAVRINPDKADSYLIRGNIRFSLREYDKALQDYDRVLSIDGKNTAAMLGKAKSLGVLGKIGEAMEIIGKIKKTAEDPQSLTITEADIRQRNYDYEGAVKLYKQVLEKHPDDLYYLIQIGSCMGFDNKNLQAIQTLEQARDKWNKIKKTDKKVSSVPGLDSKKLYLQLNRCLITAYSDEGMYNKAIAEAEKFFREYGEDDNILHTYAYSLYRSGNKDKAAKNMKKWLETGPKTESMEKYVIIGEAYYIVNENKKAEQSLRKAEERDPRNPYVYMNLGVLYLQMKQYAKAKINLEKALSMKISRKDREYIRKHLQNLPR